MMANFTHWDQLKCNWLSVVLTGNSGACRSLRSKTPGRLGRVSLLCLRSAAEGK